MFGLRSDREAEKKLLEAADSGDIQQFSEVLSHYLDGHSAVLPSLEGGLEALYRRFYQNAHLTMRSHKTFRDVLDTLGPRLVTENRLLLKKATINAAISVGCLEIIDELLQEDEIKNDAHLLILSLEAAFHHYRPRLCRSLLGALNVLHLSMSFQSAMRYFNKLFHLSTPIKFATQKHFPLYGVETEERCCEAVYRYAKEATTDHSGFFLGGYELKAEDVKRFEPAQPQRVNAFKMLLQERLDLAEGHLLQFLMRQLRFGGILCPAQVLVQDIFGGKWEESPEFSNTPITKIERQGEGILVTQHISIVTFKIQTPEGVYLCTPCEADATASLYVQALPNGQLQYLVRHFDIQDKRIDLGLTSKVFEKLVNKTRLRISAGLA